MTGITNGTDEDGEEMEIAITDEDRERWDVQRRDSKWKKIINENVVGEALPWYRQQKIKPTLRTIYYRLVGLNIIPNTKSAYGSLTENIKLARQDGRIEWDEIVDSVRHTVEDFDYDYYVSPADYVRGILNRLKELPDNYQDYLYKWCKQKDIVEIWLEKDALSGTFGSILEGRHVRIAVNRGFGSWPFAYENLRRLSLMAYRSRNHYGIVPNIHIRYFGDYDPSGKSMDDHIENQLKFLIEHEFPNLEGHVFFQRMGVTKKQIEQYNLPYNPDKETREKLEKDSRTKKFIEEHEGTLFAVELDALLAYVPDEFRRLVIESVDMYYDKDVYEELASLKEHKKQNIRRLIKKMISEFT